MPESNSQNGEGEKKEGDSERSAIEKETEYRR
jgi:hypothetical protein